MTQFCLTIFLLLLSLFNFVPYSNAGNSLMALGKIRK